MKVSVLVTTIYRSDHSSSDDLMDVRVVEVEPSILPSVLEKLNIEKADTYNGRGIKLITREAVVLG